MYPTILDDTRFNFTLTCLTIFGRVTSMNLVTESQHLLFQWQDAQTCSYGSTDSDPPRLLQLNFHSIKVKSYEKGSGYWRNHYLDQNTWFSQTTQARVGHGTVRLHKLK